MLTKYRDAADLSYAFALVHKPRRPDELAVILDHEMGRRFVFGIHFFPRRHVLLLYEHPHPHGVAPLAVRVVTQRPDGDGHAKKPHSTGLAGFTEWIQIQQILLILSKLDFIHQAA